MRIVALIPARGGSKGIPNKNIKNFCGSPLINYSIKLANQCNLIDDVIVSTDSNEIAQIAKKYGASVPFIRPSEISQDNSTDIEFIKHYIDWSNKNEKIPVDLIVHLRPTYPIRTPELLNNCINKMIENYNNYDSLRTVVLNTGKTPFKMYSMSDNMLVPVISKSSFPFLNEPHNMCRQDLPSTYLHNGCIDIIKTSIIKEENSISGNKIYPVFMSPDELNDIDTMDDWKIAEIRYKSRDKPKLVIHPLKI